MQQQAPHSAPPPNASGNIVITSDTKDERALPAKTGFFSRATVFGPVERDHGDLPLLAMSFVTGMVDGASFRNWGMFIGMQTGNTVILGLSTAGLPANPHVWLTTLVSILTFLLGAFCTFRLSRIIAPDGPHRNRFWTSMLFLVQALLILLSAALATPSHLIPQEPGGTSRTTKDTPSVLQNIRIVSLIPPLAFQSGVQIATSRLLGFNELPVNVLTSTYCDLMGDAKLMATNNVRRNRRVASVVLLLIGSIVGGWLMRSEGGLMSVLWLSGGIKFVVAGAVFALLPALKEIPK
ncbi:hypothetical protein LTR08_007840 [Meristemomyces frigidus]|nr:hypothetical protein LTR08_007840 [Meristemomyces frigidus]